jgi:ketosteroid isomerase-like protein
MSPESENVEIVRATIDSLNRGDLDQALEAAHEDLEADWSNSIAPHGGVYRGRERVRELFEAFLEAWEEFRWDLQEILEAVGFAHP